MLPFWQDYSEHGPPSVLCYIVCFVEKYLLVYDSPVLLNKQE